MTGQSIKGWCPGAYRPMMSGDGLIVRVRPRLGQLSAAQVLGLCEIAQTHASGVLDLTNRANIQMRGVRDHQAVLDALLALDLLDDTPALEAKRNIITAPCRGQDSRTTRTAKALASALHRLPDLPAKFGIAVDAESALQLCDAPGDIRVETASNGGLIVRADGAADGQPVTEADVVDASIALAQWFCSTATPDTRRMKALLAKTPLPSRFAGAVPTRSAAPLAPGRVGSRFAYGAPFGAVQAAALADLVTTAKATTLTVAPNRIFVLDHGGPHPEFICTPDDPRLSIHACPGAPFCDSATVPTRNLAVRATRTLHISGCAKGCAHPKPADVVAVGRDGVFDLVRNGHPWDEPLRRGIAPDRLAAELERMG